MYDQLMCALLGLLAEEETDSEDDGGLPHGDRSQRRGAAGHGNGSSQQEIQPFSANQITDRQSGCPVDHSHKISEEINLSFKNNGEFLIPS